MLTSSNSTYQIGVKNQEGKWKCISAEFRRPLQVHWYCLEPVLHAITKLDFGLFPIRWRFTTYFQYRAWYSIFSDHDPLYLSKSGEKFLEQAKVFINRDSVRYVMFAVNSVHKELGLLKEWTHRHYKHAKSNLIGLDMCRQMVKKDFVSFIASELPQIPPNKEEYRKQYDCLLSSILEKDIDKLPPQDNDMILSLHSRLT